MCCKIVVVISLDSPSCGVCLLDPRTGGCIGTLPDRPRIVPFEVRLSRDNSGGSATVWQWEERVYISFYYPLSVLLYVFQKCIWFLYRRWSFKYIYVLLFA